MFIFGTWKPHCSQLRLDSLRFCNTKYNNDDPNDNLAIDDQMMELFFLELSGVGPSH